MGRIAENSVEQVRDRSDIVEVVRELVPGLKRAGRSWKARCPFHQEKTPSFMVNPEKQIFHCFGCQEGGDVFKFMMKLEGLSFPEAVERLAERAGVRLESAERELGPDEKRRLGLYRALELARDYYHAVLSKTAAAAEARAYFARRGLDEPTIARFKLGFAPRAGGLQAALGKRGVTVETLKEAGLAAERAGRLRDYFWDRVIFPIENARGEVVGFGARTLGDGEPKYLNSPETPLFSKGKVLYGFSAALPALRKERAALLLEGYMDVLALHQHGLANACAPLGTALTPEHADRLKRYAERVTIVFDPDAAGIKAALRGAELLLERGLTVAVASLPDGLDPDELLQQRGREAFLAALARAEDLPSFQARVLLAEAGEPLTAEAKSRVARAVLETIARSPDEVLKSEWIRALGERLRVPEGALLRQLAKTAEPAAPRAAGRRGPEPAREPEGPLPVLEREILLYLLRAPGLAAGELVAESDFTDARARAILGAQRAALAAAGEGAWSAAMLESLEPGPAALARGLLLDERELRDPERELSRIVGRLRKQRRLAEITPLVLEGAADPEVHREYTRLLSELKGRRKGE